MDNAALDFSQVHLDYQRMLKRWIMEYDFYRGGIHVLQPNQPVQTIGWWELDTTTAQSTRDSALLGSSAQTALSNQVNRNTFQWLTGEVNSYIFKHGREKKSQYYERSGRAYHIPVFRPMINILCSCVLKTGPERKLPEEDFWEYFVENVDMNGTPMDPFIREQLTMANCFGRQHVIVDMPRAGDGIIRSLADQRDKMILPYLRPILPFDLINWSIDECGSFRWVVIREDEPDERAPGQMWQKTNSQFRVWYPDRWELWRRNKINTNNIAYSLAAEGAHSAGCVPLATIYAHRGNRTLFGCESPLADIVDIDRSIFNKLSLLDELLYKQTFSVFAIGRREGAPVPNIDLGPGKGLEYDQESGPPMFLSPDPNQPRVLWEIIKDLFAAARMASEIGRGQAEASKEARSAAAIGAEQGDRGNVMASLAESVEQFEEQVYRIAGRYMGTDETPDVVYSRQFDLRGLNAQIADMVQLQSMQIDARVLKYMAKPIVARMMKEAGSCDDDIELAMQYVDAQAMEKPREESPIPEVANPNSYSADNQAMKRGSAMPTEKEIEEDGN